MNVKIGLPKQEAHITFRTLRVHQWQAGEAEARQIWQQYDRCGILQQYSGYKDILMERDLDGGGSPISGSLIMLK